MFPFFCYQLIDFFDAIENTIEYRNSDAQLESPIDNSKQFLLAIF
jgi:hypothetical protein